MQTGVKSQVSLSEVWCARHTITTRRMYAEQEEAGERCNSRKVGELLTIPLQLQDQMI